MARKKVITTVYLDAEQAERLRAISDETGIPQARLIRDGVDLVIDRHEAARRVAVHGRPDIPPKLDPPSLPLPFGGNDR